MSYHVQLTRRAKRDANGIFGRIAERSRDGAERWYAQFLEELDSLKSAPEIHGRAPESEDLGIDLRETLFKTPKGRRYRVLFQIKESTVYILAVRGPRQTLVDRNDLS